MSQEEPTQASAVDVQPASCDDASRTLQSDTSEKSNHVMDDETVATELSNFIGRCHTDKDACDDFDKNREKWLKVVRFQNELGLLSLRPLLHDVAEKGFVTLGRRLLETGADVNALSGKHQQALHVACRSRRDDMVKLLVENKADLEHFNSRGRIPLHLAIQERLETETIRILLGPGNQYINKAERRSQMTPLNFAVVWGNKEAVEVILRHNPNTTIKDRNGKTPIFSAFERKSYAILVKLIGHLVTKIDAQDHASGTIHGQEMEILTKLCAPMSTSGKEPSLQEAQYLAKGILRRPGVADEDGKTALHYAMQSAAEDAKLDNASAILGVVPRQSLLQRDREGKTAFDVTTTSNGPVEIIEELTKKMIEKLNRDESRDDLLIWLAEHQEHHDKAKQILSEMPQAKSVPEDLKQSEWNLVEWAIYHRLPRVLLSCPTLQKSPTGKQGASPRELGRKIIEFLKQKSQEDPGSPSANASETAKEKGSRETSSKEVLIDMEHILNYLIVKTPKFKETMKLSEPTHLMQDSMDNFRATVTQIRPGDPEFTRFAVSVMVNDLIYKDASIRTVGDTISKYQALPTSIDAKGLELNAAATGGTGKVEKEFKWIHLPSTNMEWMKDVMKKISTQEGYTYHEFEKLASFFRSTWIQMPDETSSSRSMRPRYVKRDFESTSHSKSGFAQVENSRLNLKNVDPDPCTEGRRTPLKSSALYMPFFSFSKYHEDEISERDSRPKSTLNSVKSTDENEMIEREYLRKRQKLFEAYEKGVIHGSSPLDEYQYHFDGDAESSKDRDSRNRSQVVTRCITKLRRRLQTTELTTKARHTEELEMDQPNCWPIIRVSQLWAWTIADAWLITSTSCAKSEPQSSFVEDVFEHLKHLAEEGDQVTGPATPDELLKVIVEYCVGAYERQVNIGDDKAPQQRSIRRMFSDSINDTVRGQTDLFRLFAQGSRKWTTQKLQATTRHAENLMNNIKDVRDELNILKNVAKLQQQVQSNLEKTVTEGHNLTAAYVCNDIGELDRFAERIHGDVNTTMAFHESEIANLEALEAAKQGRKIFVFTVVTIIFVSAFIPSAVVQCRYGRDTGVTDKLPPQAPLSFLTSLFALDVASFLEAPTWSLIVIFAVSVLMVAFLSVVMFAQIKIPSISRSGKQKDKTDKIDSTDQKDGVLSGLERTLRLRRDRKKQTTWA